MLRLSPVRAVLYGGLTVGTLDILDAFIFFGLRSGSTPQRILQSIASGFIGRQAATQGGLKTAVLGAVLHFFIASMIVLVYYLASRRLRILSAKPIVCGILYGLGVYAVMNYVVVPLSAIGGGVRIAATPVLINGLLIHAFGVGLPSALFARAAARAS
jgi:hypothetical protein